MLRKKLIVWKILGNIFKIYEKSLITFSKETLIGDSLKNIFK